ncbi:hypothetical protein NH8B_2845 [Pseudogulbenkiania sp. NH8B]|nr:hypothetical protein NH8B_2845 [Pseudogulbenkiania sp. NH8B]
MAGMDSGRAKPVRRRLISSDQPAKSVMANTMPGRKATRCGACKKAGSVTAGDGFGARPGLGVGVGDSGRIFIQLRMGY